MASVVKGDGRDGRWLARWRDPSGRQHKKSFPRRVDAQRWLEQMQAELHRGQYIDPAGSKLKMRDFAPHWVAGLAHLKVSTATRYRGIVEVHVVPTWGSWALGDIRHSDVQGWIAMLTARGLKPGTIRQTHRVLSLILDGAVQDGRIARNPARGVRLPRQVRDEPRILTAEQVAQMIEAAGEEGASVAVLAFTGLRFGELAALKVRRVDRVKRRLIIAESVTEVGGRLVWSTPKTHATRSVPFPASLAPWIEGLCVGKASEDLVFTSPQGGPLGLRTGVVACLIQRVKTCSSPT